jgi:hypothetical protein
LISTAARSIELKIENMLLSEVLRAASVNLLLLLVRKIGFYRTYGSNRAKKKQHGALQLTFAQPKSSELFF